jgi:hypothetical protein
MTFKQKVSIIALAIFSGLMGGLISDILIRANTAFADKEPKPQKLVIAEEFKLVDRNGTERASLSSNYGSLGGKYSGTELKILGDHASQNISVDSLGAHIIMGGRSDHQSSGLALSANSERLDMSFLFTESVRQSSGDPILREGVKRLRPMIEITAFPRLNFAQLSMRDANFNERVVLGNNTIVSTKTGVEHEYPVSSIMLFNENGNVLWSVP